MLALYLALYSLGRFFVEGLRVDPAHEIGPFRLNQVVAARRLRALARGARAPAAPAAAAAAPARPRELLAERRLAVRRRARGHDHAHRAAAAVRLLERHRAADAPGALAHGVDAAVHAAAHQLVLARAAAVVGDHQLDAALLERARGDVDARAAGVLDGVRGRLLRDAVERDLGLAVERVDRARVDLDLDLVRLRELARRARRTPP